MNAKAKARGTKRQRTPFEWALLSLSSVAIACVMIGLILYAGDTAGGQAEPKPSVQLTGREIDGGLEALLEVENKAGSGAEDVVVEVEMGGETREVSFVRIAKDEKRTAAVIFPPGTTGTPKASILSYNYP